MINFKLSVNTFNSMIVIDTFNNEDKQKWEKYNPKEQIQIFELISKDLNRRLEREKAK